MDVRAKQRLCYHVAWFLSACVSAVSPHVISTVRLFLDFMKFSTIQKYFFVIGLLLAFQFGVCCQANGQTKVDNKLPADERKLRDELEQDTSFLKVACVITFMVDLDPKSLQARDENNRIKLSLYEAARSGKGVVKVKQFCGGDNVYYLVVEQGKIKLVEDYSRDRFGGLRVHSYTCSKLVLGSYELVEGNRYVTFQPIADENIANAKNKVTFSLQCEIENDKNYKKSARF